MKIMITCENENVYIRRRWRSDRWYLESAEQQGVEVVKSGTRLQSQVCDTQVIVVKASDELDDLCCGGALMVPLDAEIDSAATLDPISANGSVMGKRYVDATGTEVLVTRAGAGTLTVGSTPLVLKEAKPLPASD